MEWVNHGINPWDFLLETFTKSEGSEQKAREKILRVLSHNSILQQYNWFVRSKNLGVKLGPEHVTDEQIIYFGWIQEISSEMMKNKKGK